MATTLASAPPSSTKPHLLAPDRRSTLNTHLASTAHPIPTSHPMSASNPMPSSAAALPAISEDPEAQRELHHRRLADQIEALLLQESSTAAAPPGRWGIPPSPSESPPCRSSRGHPSFPATASASGSTPPSTAASHPLPPSVSSGGRYSSQSERWQTAASRGERLRRRQSLELPQAGAFMEPQPPSAPRSQHHQHHRTGSSQLSVSATGIPITGDQLLSPGEVLEKQYYSVPSRMRRQIRRMSHEGTRHHLEDTSGVDGSACLTLPVHVDSAKVVTQQACHLPAMTSPWDVDSQRCPHQDALSMTSVREAWQQRRQRRMQRMAETATTCQLDDDLSP